MGRRLAVYWAPRPGTPLAAFAAAWLGRDAETGAAVAQPSLPGITPARLASITASPRHYGFHATLKAPFALGPGSTEDMLVDAVRGLAARCPPFLVNLELGSLGGFLALVPSHPCEPLERLAEACVIELDPLRAPLLTDELARRRLAPLTPAEDAHLQRWGYPYVLDTFRFHMTLTERLGEPLHGRIKDALAARVAPLCQEPLRIEDVCIFAQDDRDSPFVLTHRAGLGG